MTERALGGAQVRRFSPRARALEAVEPVPRGLAPGGPTGKAPVGLDAAILTDRQRGGGDARDAKAAPCAGGHIATEGHKRPRHPGHKAGETHEGWHVWTPGRRHVCGVGMFDGPGVAAVTGAEDGQPLAASPRRPSGPGPVARWEQVSGEERCPMLAEVVHIAEHRRELQRAHRDPLLLRLMRG
jgi:hypothetical protein